MSSVSILIITKLNTLFWHFLLKVIFTMQTNRETLASHKRSIMVCTIAMYIKLVNIAASYFGRKKLDQFHRFYYRTANWLKI